MLDSTSISLKFINIKSQQNYYYYSVLIRIVIQAHVFSESFSSPETDQLTFRFLRYGQYQNCVISRLDKTWSRNQQQDRMCYNRLGLSLQEIANSAVQPNKPGLQNLI